MVQSLESHYFAFILYVSKSWAPKNLSVDP